MHQQLLLGATLLEDYQASGLKCPDLAWLGAPEQPLWAATGG